MWDLAGGRCLAVVESPGGRVAAMASRPALDVFLTGNQDATLGLWQTTLDLDQGRVELKCVKCLTGHKAPVSAVAVSSAGRWALSAAQDGIAYVWDLERGEFVAELGNGHGLVTAVGFGPDDETVLTGDESGRLRVWDLKTRRCLRTFDTHHQRVSSIACCYSQSLALTASNDRTVRVWRLGRGKPGGFVLATPHNLQQATQFKNSMRKARVAFRSGRLQEADRFVTEARSLPGYRHAPDALELGHLLGQGGTRIGLRSGWLVSTWLGHSDPVSCVAVSPDGRCVLTGGHDRSLRMWPMLAAGTDQQQRVVGKALNFVTDVALVGDDDLAVTTDGWGKRLQLWQLATGDCIQTLEGHQHFVSCVALSPDGCLALSGSYDQTLRLWQLGLDNGQPCQAVLTGHSRWVNTVDMSPDATQGLSGGGDRTLRLWDLVDGDCIQVLHGHMGPVESVVFSPDGQLALSGSWDHTVRLWDLGTGECLQTYEGHTDRVNGVRFTPDGKFAVSCSWDHTIKVWSLFPEQADSESLPCLLTLAGHSHSVAAIQLAPGGRFLISASHDQTVRVWELDWIYGF